MDIVCINTGRLESDIIQLVQSCPHIHASVWYARDQFSTHHARMVERVEVLYLALVAIQSHHLCTKCVLVTTGEEKSKR